MQGFGLGRPWRAHWVVAWGIVCALLLSAGPPAQAEEAIDPTALSDAYRLEALFEAIAHEGRDTADAIGADILEGQGGAVWARAIDDIYDPARLHERFLGLLVRDLVGREHAYAAAMAFARSPAGARVIDAEVDTRAELRVPSAEREMQARLDQARAADSPDLAFVRERIRVNNLIEQNVSLGLNGSLAYFRGFMSAAPSGMGLNGEHMQADVWAQEDDIRQETVDWLEGYFLLSYATLNGAERAELMAHAASTEGDAFNTAMFRAYEVTFTEVSQALGVAVGRVLQMRDL